MSGELGVADSMKPGDYQIWDWLPEAAQEMDAYLRRLLTEAAIKAHDVSVRVKSIESFHKKCEAKKYSDPLAEVTDIVAARIITYSISDRDTVRDLIQKKFKIKDRLEDGGMLPEGENRNPGDGRPAEERGYDSWHLVVTGERNPAGSTWVTKGGSLLRYFATSGGLEIQIRTVAAHAWAEFEHARRYKGADYDVISNHDKETINQLFAASSDARRALDETFVAIDRILANPTPPTLGSGSDGQEEPESVEGSTPLDTQKLAELLAARFPDDRPASEAGLDFARDLLRAMDIETLEGLERILESVDSSLVIKLMGNDGPVTRVRRLDDELLAIFKDSYIEKTKEIGTYSTRPQNLKSRFDRLRNKYTPYSTYELEGAGVPIELRGKRVPAARMVRELVRIIADRQGLEAVLVGPEIALTEGEVKGSLLPTLVQAECGEIWVASSMLREDSRRLIEHLLQVVSEDLDLRVTDRGTIVRPVSR